MFELVKHCIEGCAKALWVPTITAPFVYIATSLFMFSVIDLLLSIPIGAAIGLLVLSVVGLPVLVTLNHFRLNRVWLVSLIGAVLGVGLGTSTMAPNFVVVLSYGLVGAITGGVASHFSGPKPSFKRDPLVPVNSNVRFYE